MQTTNAVFLVRPASFSYNPQTATSNAFQTITALSPAAIQAKALEEFDTFVAKLRSEGVQVQVFEDSLVPVKPDAIFPNNGFRLNTSYSYLNEIHKNENVTEFAIELGGYIRLANRPTLVLANSLGYKKVSGDLQFHQYADIGNTTSLRGYRNNRFRGESVFYHNLDLRLELFKWSNTILPVDIGILGGYDYGRVWFNHQGSSTWHHSQTVGLWVNVLDVVVLQPYYSFTKEDNTISFRLGFNF